jgi:type I restriction enzyme S subunit
MTEGPYKLPEGWRWVRLGEVCSINPRRPRIKREPHTPTTFVPMSAVDDETGTIVAAEEPPFEQVRKGYTYFEENDVLFAKITPCMENGKAAIARGLLDGVGFGSTEFHVLRPSELVVSEWIWLFVRQERFRQDARKAFRGGVGQQRVPQEFLEQYLVPLPPLSEQRRIVARIEELMARVREARRLRKEALEDAERLWQSVLAETFPRPGQDLPEGWRWVRLGEVARREATLLKPSDYPSRRFRYLGMEHVAPGQWEEPEGVEINGSEIKSQVVVFHPGLVLYGKLRPYLNKVVVPHTEGVASTEFVPIAPLLDVLDPEYLQPRTRLDVLWNTPIPLPPLPEQRRIVAHLEAVQERVRALKEAQSATEAELKRLEQAILDRAFRGEL